MGMNKLSILQESYSQRMKTSELTVGLNAQKIDFVSFSRALHNISFVDGSICGADEFVYRLIHAMGLKNIVRLFDLEERELIEEALMDLSGEDEIRAIFADLKRHETESFHSDKQVFRSRWFFEANTQVLIFMIQSLEKGQGRTEWIIYAFNDYDFEEYERSVTSENLSSLVREIKNQYIEDEKL